MPPSLAQLRAPPPAAPRRTGRRPVRCAPPAPSAVPNTLEAPGGTAEARGVLIEIFRPGSCRPSAAPNSALRQGDIPAWGGCSIVSEASAQGSPHSAATRRAFPLRVRCRPAPPRPPARRSPARSPAAGAAAAAALLRRRRCRRLQRGRGQGAPRRLRGRAGRQHVH